MYAYVRKCLGENQAKIPGFKIFQRIKQIYLPYLFKSWMSSLVLIF